MIATVPATVPAVATTPATATAPAANTDRPIVAVTGRYTEVYDRAAYDAAYALARGDYQRNVLNGTEALSGATLRGAARRYGAVYANSRRSLIARCRAAGVVIGERRGAHGRRILTIG